MKVEEYISAERDVCHGKPCFKGTRIMVASILELLEAGQSTEQILGAYPVLNESHIRAALHLASELLGSEQILSFHSA